MDVSDEHKRAVAVRRPMPGMVCRKLTTRSSLAIASRLASTSLMRASMSRISWQASAEEKAGGCRASPSLRPQGGPTPRAPPRERPPE